MSGTERAAYEERLKAMHDEQARQKASRQAEQDAVQSRMERQQAERDCEQARTDRDQARQECSRANQECEALERRRAEVERRLLVTELRKLETQRQQAELERALKDRLCRQIIFYQRLLGLARSETGELLLQPNSDLVILADQLEAHYSAAPAAHGNQIP